MAADRLDGADGADDTRARSLRDLAGPLDLACELNPATVRTPALELISAALEDAITTPGKRVIISVPPQEGKTTQVQNAIVRKLQRDPHRRCAIASYGADLATDSGRKIRQLIDGNGSRATDPITSQRLPDALGIAVAHDHAAAGNWSLAGHEGGLYCIGVGGGLTGRPVDGLFVVDDPIKDMRSADSEATRTAVWSWWTSVGEARLGPSTSVVVIQTRWHEEDLAGRLIAADAELPEGEREWQVINIPALADGQTDDSLGRPAGEWLTSARRRTTGQWQAIRRRVGERVFAALYQGRPTPLEGGIFRQEWIDAHRADALPDGLVATTVAIDPADTGQGDAAGILVGSRTGDGQIWVRADLSGQLSQGEWARRACLAAVRFDADTILQESNLGMGRALRDGWSVIRRQAAALAEAGTSAGAAALLAARGDTAAADTAELGELGALLDDVLARPSTGPCRIVAVTPRQSKFVRAHAVTGLYETGRTRHVGRLPLLEHEMVTWQPGQPSPNRLDTLAHLLTHLDGARLGGSASVARARPGRGVPTSTGRDPRRGVMSRGLVRTIGGVG
jgi:hypothetical protein